MEDKNKIKLTADVLICVEGQDEKNLVDAFLRSNGVDDRKYDIKNVGGSQNFHKKMPVLSTMEWFREIKTLAIVRDAETSFENTKDSIMNTLRDIGLPVPDSHGIYTDVGAGDHLSVGFFIMPGLNRDGMLEDLCLDWFQDSKPEAWKCLSGYDSCINSLLEEKKIDPIENWHKARSLMMLAMTPGDANCLGIAAKQNFFDFKSPVWNELRDFFAAAKLF